MKGEATPRRAIELWQTGEAAELLAHFPEMTSTILPIHNQLDSIAERAAADFAAHQGRSSRKEFALAVKDLPWASVLFRMLEALSMFDDAPGILVQCSRINVQLRGSRTFFRPCSASQDAEIAP